MATTTSDTRSRNAPCPCGSGKKYKHCCLGKPVALSRTKARLLILAAFLAVLGAAFLTAQFVSVRSGGYLGVAGLLALVGYLVLRNPPPGSGRSGADRIDFGR